MDDPLIRTASPADFGAILALWEAIDRHVGLADSLQALEVIHALSSDLFLVADSQGQIVGTLIAGWDGWRAQMARLAVDEEFRRTGVARRLVNEGQRRLKQRGAQRVYALVDKRSSPAEPFWAAQGYTANEHIVQYSRNLAEGG